MAENTELVTGGKIVETVSTAPTPPETVTGAAPIVGIEQMPQAKMSDDEDSQTEGRLEEVTNAEPEPLPQVIEDAIQEATNTNH